MEHKSLMPNPRITEVSIKNANCIHGTVSQCSCWVSKQQNVTYQIEVTCAEGATYKSAKQL